MNAEGSLTAWRNAVDVEQCSQELLGLISGWKNLLFAVSLDLNEAIDEARIFTFQLAPLVEAFIALHDLDGIHPSTRATIRGELRRLMYHALLLHCLLFTNPSRSKLHELDFQALYSDWLPYTARTSLSEFGAYDKAQGGYPVHLFENLYMQVLEPIQDDLGLGLWRKTRNERKFKGFFACGIVLGVLADTGLRKLCATGASTFSLA